MAAVLLSAVALLGLISPSLGKTARGPPKAIVKNGTYAGIKQANYNQDYFLGIPFAQPPLGPLRFSRPQGLDTTWTGQKDAIAYYPECVGYGGDDMGYAVAEDCLALNVVRPSGYEGQKLPVAVWIHGGGYVMGGTADRRYNLTFVVNNSVAMNKPVIVVSIAYRLSAFGFLDSDAIRSEGVTNLGMHDQRLALQWIQENIDGFGGDPSKVTIWGESAGAGSVGIHLTAFGGRDDKLFRSAISESGSPILLGPSKYNVSMGNAIYQSITAATGCSNAANTLACLRGLDFNTLNAGLNVTPPYSFLPYTDGGLIQGLQSEQLQNGKFIKVPYLIGANTDEGSAFGPKGINSDAQFEAYLNSTFADYQTVKMLEALYPNIPALGVLDTVDFVPNATYGSQFKRAAALGGDFTFIAARRLTCQQWAAYNATAYAYRFNVIVNPNGPLVGATHFQEVAFVFNNLDGLGYTANPFQGEPASFALLSTLMARMWVSFVVDGDPNHHGMGGVENWPKYENGQTSYWGGGKDYVFDASRTSGPEADTWRGEGIAYLNSIWGSQFGK